MYVQKSFVLKPADAQKKWHLIDATDKDYDGLRAMIKSIDLDTENLIK